MSSPLSTPAFAAQNATDPLGPFTIDRRAPGDRDVLIDILFCGVCHTDIHQVRDEWGGSMYPMVPGHEIVGRVAEVGGGVTRWKVGDVVGVGVFVDSCRQCEPCRAGEEQYCDEGMVGTYNAKERLTGAVTYGGYSTRITVDEAYVVRIPEGLALDAAAPLLCAGITTYSPLKHFGAAPGQEVAVVGLGGLGHLAVKLAKAMGCRVTVLSHSPGKEEDARRLGADDFVVLKTPDDFAANACRFHLILDTVSADHSTDAYLGLVKLDGTLVLLGLPNPSPVSPFSLVGKRRRLAGSMVGGIRETQEMLDFCAEHGITADIEVIRADQVNEAYERMLRSDIKYRFVIDCGTLG